MIMEKNFTLTQLGEKRNADNFEKFRLRVASLKHTMETASLSGLSIDEKSAINTMLEKFEALKNFTSVGNDKRLSEGTYVLSSFAILPALNALHEVILSFQEKTESDDGEHLAEFIAKKKRLREKLEHLSKAMQNRLSFWKHLWWNIGFATRALIISASPMFIPLILTWAAVAINPAVFSMIVIGAIVASLGVCIGLSIYHLKQLKKVTATSFHPLKEPIDSLIQQIDENIKTSENQHELISKDQALHENIKAKRLKFFGAPGSDMSTSECYQSLIDKRDNKIALLEMDLEKTQDEINAAETALKITLALIEDNKPEIIDYEKRLLANAVTSSVSDEIKTLAKNRFKQTVALQLAKEKKVMLEAAIQAHNDPAYLPDKFDKYRSIVYSEEKITKISHERGSQNVYGTMHNGEFYPTEITVSRRHFSNPYKNAQLTLFSWHDDDSKNISSVHSLKLNIKINETAEKFEASVTNERKQWAGI